MPFYYVTTIADTYRALAAADNAVMLLDGAKGLEPQTRKLFEVCRMRQLPLFTFVNKMDRPALSPYEIMDQIEEEFGTFMEFMMCGSALTVPGNFVLNVLARP